MVDDRSNAAGLGRDDIVSLLTEVASEAERREVAVSLFLVGGAAMALAYSTSRATIKASTQYLVEGIAADSR